MREGEKKILSFLNRVYLLSPKLFRVCHAARLSSFFYQLKAATTSELSAASQFSLHDFVVVFQLYLKQMMASFMSLSHCTTRIQQPHNLTNTGMLSLFSKSRLSHQEHHFVVRPSFKLPPFPFRCMRLDKLSRLQLPYLYFGTDKNYLRGFSNIFNYIIYVEYSSLNTCSINGKYQWYYDYKINHYTKNHCIEILQFY